MKQLAMIAMPVLLLAACSGGEESVPAEEATPGAPVAISPDAPPYAEPGDVTPASDQVLRLEGLGDLRIGFNVPDSGTWSALAVQAGDGCTLYSSPDFPGVSAIVTDGLVRRITIGPESGVTLIEGIGTGASEAEVRSYFGGFRETPHKYEPAPAKYLTAPNADSGDPALRFEIGSDERVSEIHVGTMPELGFVEGCA